MRDYPWPALLVGLGFLAWVIYLAWLGGGI